MIRFAVIGMGVQGAKRKAVIGPENCITIDPADESADYPNIEAAPLSKFDVAYVCVPDSEKLSVVTYLVSHGKHVLVEKPFSLSPDEYDSLEQCQRLSGSVVYVAYNHRFEPHVVEAKQVFEEGEIGETYTVYLSYGNGTAQLVRASEWRDTGLGVIPDLGSHLLDLVDFWWGLDERAVDCAVGRRFENQSPDFATFELSGSPNVWCQTTMLSWRNDFRCDALGSEGSLHIASLCKWGPTSLTVRNRVRPSGVPRERVKTLVQSDPTWQLEHEHFLQLVNSGNPGNMDSSRKIAGVLDQLAKSLSE